MQRRSNVCVIMSARFILAMSAETGQKLGIEELEGCEGAQKSKAKYTGLRKDMGSCFMIMYFSVYLP